MGARCAAALSANMRYTSRSSSAGKSLALSRTAWCERRTGERAACRNGCRRGRALRPPGWYAADRHAGHYIVDREPRRAGRAHEELHLLAAVGLHREHMLATGTQRVVVG